MNWVIGILAVIGAVCVALVILGAAIIASVLNGSVD